MSAPNFNAWLEVLTSWSVDTQNLAAAIPSYFDVDKAVGAQQDVVGEWIGAKRGLAVPLTGVYFSLDVAGLGLDEGSLMGPFDPATGLQALPDEQYRLLQYATIAANQWDGTIPGAYDAWSAFEELGYSILIQDNEDMSMSIVLIGRTPDAITRAMFLQGYIKLKPGTVRLAGFFIPSVANTPIFGLDANNASVAGLGIGALPIQLT